jgi:hypothetical protein
MYELFGRYTLYVNDKYEGDILRIQTLAIFRHAYTNIETV